MKYFFYLSVILLLTSIAHRVVNLPYFRIAHIDIQPAHSSGSLKKVQVPHMFEVVRPALTGSFFTINLKEAQRLALAQPWVQQVKIDRIPPSGVRVQIKEYEAAARWIREGEEAGLIASDGAVFQAAFDEKLPELDGDYVDLPMMLDQYRVFESRLKTLRLDIKRLQYTPRAAWNVMLSNGVEVRLGKNDVHKRLLRFTELWPREWANKANSLDYVDMRYADGAAVRQRKDVLAD